MILRVPEYFKEFQCLASQCKDCCCIGWEVDIDEDTFLYYKQLDGAFGERVKKNMRNGKEHSFILQKGRCPFLNETNLCDICVELGEQALCEVCTEYPRFTLEYGNVREKCMALSCEEVGRLMFQNRNKMRYEEYMLSTEPEYELESEELHRIELLEESRDCAIYILQNRERCIEQRIGNLLIFAEKIQNAWNELQQEKIPTIIKEYRENKETKIVIDPEKKAGWFLERMHVFEEMELLDAEWGETYQRVLALLKDLGVGYEEWLVKFRQVYVNRDAEYEQLMVYFIMRYYMKSVYDGNVLAKVKFAVASFLMIRDMDVERYVANGETYGLEDRIDVARIYSKEVEHSEENLEYLADCFLFEEVFEVSALMEQL